MWAGRRQGRVEQHYTGKEGEGSGGNHCGRSNATPVKCLVDLRVGVGASGRRKRTEGFDRFDLRGDPN